jgi:hypothetical protein
MRNGVVNPESHKLRRAKDEGVTRFVTELPGAGGAMPAIDQDQIWPIHEQQRAAGVDPGHRGDMMEIELCRPADLRREPFERDGAKSKRFWRTLYGGDNGVDRNDLPIRGDMNFARTAAQRRVFDHAPRIVMKMHSLRTAARTSSCRTASTRRKTPALPPSIPPA